MRLTVTMTRTFGGHHVADPTRSASCAGPSGSRSTRTTPGCRRARWSSVLIESQRANLKRHDRRRFPRWLSRRASRPPRSPRFGPGTPRVWAVPRAAGTRGHCRRRTRRAGVRGRLEARGVARDRVRGERRASAAAASRSRFLPRAGRRAGRRVHRYGARDDARLRQRASGSRWRTSRKGPGEVFYFVDGSLHSEADGRGRVPRASSPAMRADLQHGSGAPDGGRPSPRGTSCSTSRRSSECLDDARCRLNHRAEWSRSRTRPSTDARSTEQSCLNFLLFIHADRRAKFAPFGVFSDERFHVVDGNDASQRASPHGPPGRSSSGKRSSQRAKDCRGRHRS